MAAAEDDWSKFMKDLHSDLSKLPEQDFANALDGQGARRDSDGIEDGRERC